MKVLIALSILAVVAAIPQPELRQPVQYEEDPKLEQAQSPKIEHAQHSHQEKVEPNNNEVDDVNENKKVNGDIERNLEDLIKAIEKIKSFLHKGHNHKQVPKDEDDNEIHYERNPDDEANVEKDENIPADRPHENDQEFSNILNNKLNFGLEEKTPIPKRESVVSEFDDKITINSVLNKGDEIVLDNEITNVVPKTSEGISDHEGLLDLGKVEPVVRNTVINEPQENVSDDKIVSTEKSVDVTHDQEKLPNVHHFRPSFLNKPHRLPRPHFRVPIILD